MIISLSHITLTEMWAWAGLTHSLLCCCIITIITILTTMLIDNYECRLCLNSVFCNMCRLIKEMSYSNVVDFCLTAPHMSYVFAAFQSAFLHNWASTEVLFLKLSWFVRRKADICLCGCNRLNHQSFCWAFCEIKYDTADEKTENKWAKRREWL